MRNLSAVIALASAAVAALSPPATTRGAASPPNPATPILAQAEAPAPAGISAEEARSIAIDTYIYAYPLILSELTRRASVGKPRGAPVNQFAHKPAFPDASFTQIVRPNADTLYSILWYDLSKEPLAVSVPDSGGRYYLLSMLDMWTDVFATPGSRTTGNKAQLIVLARIGWKGSLANGATLIRSPTAVGWIIGRIQTNGKADYPNVHKFQAGLSAVPLSQYGTPYVPPKPKIDPGWDVKTPPVDLIERMSPKEYFELFAQLMKANPPHANDYPIVHRMARIGIEPGKSFAFATAQAGARQALDAAVAPALKAIKTNAGSRGVLRNGWRTSLSAIGTYGTDYLARAAVAHAGLGANPVEDAIYPTASVDADGQLLSSDMRYVLHFARDQIPPVRAFWSLTLYDARQLFAANPLGRHAIGDRDKLKFNDDGSLDLYIQRNTPGSAKESNWLPAPVQGDFSLTLRLYWPGREALDGSWAPPPIRKVP